MEKLEKPTNNEKELRIIFLVVISISSFLLLFMLGHDQQVLGQFQNQSAVNTTDIAKKPSLSDPNLKIESVATGFDFPTGIAFLGTDDILHSKKTPEKYSE
jgi:hypothetical protein